MDTTRRYSRRTFVAWVGGASAGFYLFGRLPGMSAPAALAAIPVGTLNPLGVPKYQTPMLIPPVMPTARKITDRRGQKIDYYEISVKQFPQQILPPAFRRPRCGATARSLRRARAACCFTTRHRSPSRRSGTTRPREMDQRPCRTRTANICPTCCRSIRRCTGPTRPAARRPGHAADLRSHSWSLHGPVPIVTHVHGAVGVGDESDGYAEAWYLPAASNIPAGYATEGTWYNFFRDKAAGEFRRRLGTRLRDLPISERTTRLDDLVPRSRARHDPAQRLCGPGRFLSHSRRSGWRRGRARFPLRAPGRAPRPGAEENDKFPPNKTYYEIPIAIQDRSFNADGSLFYPDTRAFFDGSLRTAFIPETRCFTDLEPRVFRQHDHGERQHWPFQRSSSDAIAFAS